MLSGSFLHYQDVTTDRIRRTVLKFNWDKTYILKYQCKLKNLRLQPQVFKYTS